MWHFCWMALCKSSYSHRMTPFFSSFWKSWPMVRPVISLIHCLSSSSFWGSYFWAIWVGGDVKEVTGGKGKTACIHSVSLVATSDTRSWETNYPSIRLFIHMNKNYKPKWKNRDRFVVNLVCFVIILTFAATQFQCRFFFFTYLKTRAHTQEYPV